MEDIISNIQVSVHAHELVIVTCIYSVQIFTFAESNLSEKVPCEVFLASATSSSFIFFTACMSAGDNFANWRKNHY